MRLPMIAERLSERFVRPLAVDRVRALVRPAMEEARTGGDAAIFSLLQQEIESLAEQPSGVGSDLLLKRFEPRRESEKPDNETTPERGIYAASQ